MAHQSEVLSRHRAAIQDRFALVCSCDNTSSRTHPAGGRPKLQPTPANRRNVGGEKTRSRRESPPIPAYPGSTMTGLSRRRSRVRVPTLPLKISCRSASFVASSGTIDRRFLTGHGLHPHPESRALFVSCKALQIAMFCVRAPGQSLRSSRADPASESPVRLFRRYVQAGLSTSGGSLGLRDMPTPALVKRQRPVGVRGTGLQSRDRLLVRHSLASSKLADRGRR